MQVILKPTCILWPVVKAWRTSKFCSKLHHPGICGLRHSWHESFFEHIYMDWITSMSYNIICSIDQSVFPQFVSLRIPCLAAVRKLQCMSPTVRGFPWHLLLTFPPWRKGKGWNSNSLPCQHGQACKNAPLEQIKILYKTIVIVSEETIDVISHSALHHFKYNVSSACLTFYPVMHQIIASNFER